MCNEAFACADQVVRKGTALERLLQIVPQFAGEPAETGRRL
jgi:hypothetical protein